jgi:class 3 adenylate cyclase
MLKHLRLADRLAFGLFLVLWLGCLGLKLASYRHPVFRQAYVALRAGDDYPVVQGYMRAGADSLTPLRLGDRVLRVGARDARGYDQARFVAAFEEGVWRGDGAVPILVERDGRELALRDAQPTRQPAAYATDFVTSLAWGIAAILIIIRAKQTRTTRAFHRAMAASAILYTVQFVGPFELVLAKLVLATVFATITWPLLLLAYLAFPEEASVLRGWNRVWPWLFLPIGVPALTNAYAVPFAPFGESALSSAMSFVYLGVLVAALTFNYRHSGPLGRRQVKWTILAVYLGTLATICTYAVLGTRSAFEQDAPLWARLVIMLASASFPISVMIAILRYDLFDIDRVVGATVGYNLLGVAVVGGGFYLVPALTDAFTTLLGVTPSVGRSGTIIGMAVVVMVTERRLRPVVERLFFKERFALEQAMRVLPEKFAASRKADELFELTGRELAQHLRPSSCVIYETAGDSYVPVIVEGDTLAPAIPAGTPLLHWVASLDGAHLVTKRSAADAGPEGAAVLASLDTRLIFPVHRADGLEAFVCLGEKRSGDIYTHTDVLLLTALGKTMSSHMLRFDEAELLSRARAMQDKMRRYVPGAIAEAIASGTDLETGEREVSVLFVDMRGYTSFADTRKAETIFSTVNRYTDAVSTIVNECGGVVVEFNGDGMMAVFGAPRPLADKERAAVATAKRLVETVPLLRQDDPNAPPMRVGVGVATGAAFVGNIEAADRTIWSAIGSTTNLAARLQSLTRDFDAALLIDSLTFERGVTEPQGFTMHENVKIRGRKGVETIFAYGSVPAGARTSTGA